MKIKYPQYFWSFVIVLASVRGAFVYHFGLPPDMTYIFSSVLLIVFGLLSYRSLWARNCNNSILLLRKAIKVNTLFIGFYLLLSMVTISLNQASMIYLFGVFPIIFSIVKYDKRLLNGVVHAIMIVTVFGVIYFYNLGISGGFDAINNAHSKLRGEFSYSRIGHNLLPAGYQGSHHDAANILVMGGAYYLSKAMFELGKFKKYLFLTTYFFVLFASLLTGSAANIIVLIGTSGLAIMSYAKKHPYAIGFVICCSFFVLPLMWGKIVDYTYFYEKASYDQSQYESGGMFNSLDMNSIFSSFHTIIVGGGPILKVPMVYSEIAFVKILVGIGLIPFSIFMFICFSPIYYIYKLSKNIKVHAQLLGDFKSGISKTIFMKNIKTRRLKLIGFAMPVLAGTMTLLHYGSLFRVTSVGLYCVLLALFYKEFLDINQENQNDTA
jgi:hypothetical protein